MPCRQIAVQAKLQRGLPGFKRANHEAAKAVSADLCPISGRRSVSQPPTHLHLLRFDLHGGRLSKPVCIFYFLNVLGVVAHRKAPLPFVLGDPLIIFNDHIILTLSVQFWLLDLPTQEEKV